MKKLKIFLATLAGTGLLPFAPGTMGSLFSLILLYPVALLAGDAGLLAAVLAGSLLTLWTAGESEKQWGPDPAPLVLDEFSGQALALLFLPFTGFPGTDLVLLGSSFLLFRFFDILKPLGIKQLQDFPSGFGILIDDIAAGIYASVCLHSGIWVISSLQAVRQTGAIFLQ